jgi:hypothetical protein
MTGTVPAVVHVRSAPDGDGYHLTLHVSSKGDDVPLHVPSYESVAEVVDVLHDLGVIATVVWHIDLTVRTFAPWDAADWSTTQPSGTS